MPGESFNIGEWSELYTLYKLLADGKIYAADSELEKIEDLYFPILKILRDEFGESLEYHLNSVIKIINASSGEIIRTIPVQEFIEKSLIVLDKMKNHYSTSGSFSIPEVEVVREESKTLNFKSGSQDKSDIRMVVHDLRTGQTPELGFSIKSRIGSPSTLFNPSRLTNIIYKTSPPMDTYDISEVNSIEGTGKIRRRISEIQKKGHNLQYYDIEGMKLKLNLQLIDTALPEIIANMVFTYYSGMADSSTLSDIVSFIEDSNPVNFNNAFGHDFYKYKVRNMLTDMSLGMTSRNIWDGKYDATGGYIVVREDGELVCYHIYNRYEFQEYLLKNTRFETPSTRRYDFGYVYSENNQTFIKLNMQIRFLK